MNAMFKDGVLKGLGRNLYCQPLQKWRGCLFEKQLFWFEVDKTDHDGLEENTREVNSWKNWQRCYGV